jgi:hypothetical protein
MELKQRKFRKALIVQVVFVLSIFFLLTRPADNSVGVYNKIKGSTDSHPELLAKRAGSIEEFQRVFDSLERISYWKDNRLSLGLVEEGVNLFIGVSRIYECDSCYDYPSDKTKDEGKGFKNKYYLRLNGYTLRPNSFFKIEKDKNFVRNFTWTQEGNMSVGNGKDIETRFRLAVGGYPGMQTALLMPVSKQAYSFLKTMFYIIFTPLILFFIWAVFILPGLTLYRIAMGKVFIYKNIRNLRIAGISVIIIVLLPVIFNLIFQLIMKQQLPEGIYFPVGASINQNKGWLIAGISFLVIAEAFKSGYKLQQEQDLTI